jgi:hypothetical protein
MIVIWNKLISAHPKKGADNSLDAQHACLRLLSIMFVYFLFLTTRPTPLSQLLATDAGFSPLTFTL